MSNDLKDLFSGALAQRPPLPSSQEMLAHARAAERRRTAYLAVGGSGAVAVAAVAAVAIVVPNLPGSGGERIGSPPQPPPSSVPASAPGDPTPSAPPGKAGVPMSHGRELANGLTTSVPVAYSPTSLVDYSYAPTTFDPGEEREINAVAVVRITLRGAEGTLTAYITRDRKPDPAGDLCAPEVATRVGFAAETCEVITVEDKRIRVTTATYPRSGLSMSATLFLGDGWLTVTEHLGGILPADFTDPLPPDANPLGMARNDDGQRNPPLVEFPLPALQLARTCAAPAMMPRS